MVLASNDPKGRSALHLATMRGDDEWMLGLLTTGADVTAVDRRGNTPLHYSGHVETLQLLVKFGADLFVRNQHGDRPIDLMRRKGVKDDVIHLTEQMMSATSLDDPTQTLLNHPISTIKYSEDTISHLLYEFCTEMGARRLIVILVIVLCLSLYTAYIVTGIGLAAEGEILVDDGGMGGSGNVRRVEL